MISTQNKNFIAGFLGASILLIIAIIVTRPSTKIEETQLNSNKVLGERTMNLGGETFDVPESIVSDEQISAKSYIAFDSATGEIHALKAPNTPMPIASLTKLMTGYLAVKNGILNDEITLGTKDIFSVKPVLGLKQGDIINGIDLFRSMIIGSANDAAMALGDALETKNNKPIAEQMTEEAESLGMTNTRYDNPLGFDSDTNYSTVADLKILVTAIEQISSFTELRKSTEHKFISKNGRPFYIRATNKLIGKNLGIEAIKTGYTDEAKGAMATSFVLGNNRVVIIVLNSDNRENDTLLIKNRVTENFNKNNASAQ